MKSSIFEYKSYKTYLTDVLKSQPKGGRGYRTQLASAAGCQMAYISQVLGGERHFTFEQAEGINSFLGHDSEESRFFLLLLSHARAGTPSLRSRYEADIRRELERHLTMKDRFKGNQISREAQAVYYSAWHYSAIHVALTIAGLRTKEALRRNFGLPLPVIAEALEFLCHAGLAEQRGTEYHPGVSNIFLGNDSPWIGMHHKNWRFRAVESLDARNSDDLHYSAVVSIRTEDFEKLKLHLIKAIEDGRKVWNEAKQEDELCAVGIDWFRLRAKP